MANPNMEDKLNQKNKTEIYVNETESLQGIDIELLEFLIKKFKQIKSTWGLRP
jgi:hypothetical protein